MSRGICLLLILFFFMLLPWLFVDIMSVALEKLAIAPTLAPFIVLLMFVGSLINIPLLRESIPGKLLHHPLSIWGLERHWPKLQQQVTEKVIAINVGGFVVPMLLVVYEVLLIWTRYPQTLLPLAMAVLINILLCYSLARPIPQVGITLPALIPGMIAAISAMLLAPNMAAPVAFCAGVLGPVIGADLMYLNKIRETQVGMASIGGAGTFDGIVISGLVAVLLT